MRQRQAALVMTLYTYTTFFPVHGVTGNMRALKVSSKHKDRKQKMTTRKFRSVGNMTSDIVDATKEITSHSKIYTFIAVVAIFVVFIFLVFYVWVSKATVSTVVNGLPQEIPERQGVSESRKAIPKPKAQDSEILSNIISLETRLNLMEKYPTQEVLIGNMLAFSDTYLGLQTVRLSLTEGQLEQIEELKLRFNKEALVHSHRLLEKTIKETQTDEEDARKKLDRISKFVQEVKFDCLKLSPTTNLDEKKIIAKGVLDKLFRFDRGTELETISIDDLFFPPDKFFTDISKWLNEPDVRKGKPSANDLLESFKKYRSENKQALDEPLTRSAKVIIELLCAADQNGMQCWNDFMTATPAPTSLAEFNRSKTADCKCDDAEFEKMKNLRGKLESKFESQWGEIFTNLEKIVKGDAIVASLQNHVSDPILNRLKVQWGGISDQFENSKKNLAKEELRLMIGNIIQKQSKDVIQADVNDVLSAIVDTNSKMNKLVAALKDPNQKMSETFKLLCDAIETNVSSQRQLSDMQNLVNLAESTLTDASGDTHMLDPSNDQKFLDLLVAAYTVASPKISDVGMQDLHGLILERVKNIKALKNNALSAFSVGCSQLKLRNLIILHDQLVAKKGSQSLLAYAKNVIKQWYIFKTCMFIWKNETMSSFKIFTAWRRVSFQALAKPSSKINFSGDVEFVDLCSQWNTPAPISTRIQNPTLNVSNFGDFLMQPGGGDTYLARHLKSLFPNANGEMGPIIEELNTMILAHNPENGSVDKPSRNIPINMVEPALKQVACVFELGRCLYYETHSRVNQIEEVKNLLNTYETFPNADITEGEIERYQEQTGAEISNMRMKMENAVSHQFPCTGNFSSDWSEQTVAELVKNVHGSVDKLYPHSVKMMLIFQSQLYTMRGEFWKSVESVKEHLALLKLNDTLKELKKREKELRIYELLSALNLLKVPILERQVPEQSMQQIANNALSHNDTEMAMNIFRAFNSQGSSKTLVEISTHITNAETFDYKEVIGQIIHDPAKFSHYIEIRLADEHPYGIRSDLFACILVVLSSSLIHTEYVNEVMLKTKTDEFSNLLKKASQCAMETTQKIVRAANQIHQAKNQNRQSSAQTIPKNPKATKKVTPTK